MQVYTARHILPVSSPALRDGAIVVTDGRISRVGTRSEIEADLPDGTPVHDLGPTIVLPGLVNAHTHLELSWTAEEQLPLGDYVDWLRALLVLRQSQDTTRAAESAERAIRFAVDRGTVAVGDVGNEGWIARLIARSPLSGVIFHELYGLENDRAEATLARAVEGMERLAADEDVAAAGDRLCLALTPHAPHTTSTSLLRALAGRAEASGEPLSIHVAESAAEVSLLSDGSGKLAELFRERAFAGEDWKPPGRSPVEHLKRLGALSERTLAVHCVHLDQRDRSSLQSSRATVVTCPRSNAALGVGTAPVPELMREGIPVAVGTDSLASAPDLDMFAEMCALRLQHPDLSPAAVLRMATLSGARALGLGDRLGSIEVGKLAELIVIPCSAEQENPLDLLCANPDRVYRLDRAASELAETDS
jgi:cytosine/adenosine deaminase-related metal-dependent hydrolase